MAQEDEIARLARNRLKQPLQSATGTQAANLLGGNPRNAEFRAAMDATPRPAMSAEAAYGERVNPTPKPAPASNYVSPGVGGRDPFSPQGPAVTPATTPPAATGGFGRAREALNRALPSQPVGSGAVGQGLKSFAGGAAKLAGRLAAPVAVGMEGIDVARVAADPNASGIDVVTQAAQGAGRLGAAGVGAATGAALGSVVPVVGTAIGGIAGGLAGYYGADKAIEAGRRMLGTDPSAPASRAPGLVDVPAQAVAAPTPGRPAQPFRDPRILGNPGTIAEQVAAAGTPTAAATAGANQVNVTRQPNGVMSFSGGPNIGQDGGEISYNAGASGFKPGGFGVTSLGGKIAPSAESQATLTNPDGSRWTAQDSAVMAANMRDGIDPYQGTSRQAGSGSSSFGGQAGGIGILSDAYEAKRVADMDLAKAGRLPRKAVVPTIGALGNRETAAARALTDQAANATAIRGQDVSAATSAANNKSQQQIAAERAGLENRRLGIESSRAERDAAKAKGDLEAQGFGLRSAARTESAQKILLDPASTSEQRRLAQSTLAALNGKTAADRMQVVNLPDTETSTGLKIGGGQALIRTNEDGTVEQVPIGTQQAKASISTDPRALAIKNNTSLSMAEKQQQLKALGYQ